MGLCSPWQCLLSADAVYRRCPWMWLPLHLKAFSRQLLKPYQGLSSSVSTKVKPLHGWKSLTKHLARALMEALNRIWQPRPLLQVQGGEVCRYGVFG